MTKTRHSEQLESTRQFNRGQLTHPKPKKRQVRERILLMTSNTFNMFYIIENQLDTNPDILTQLLFVTGRSWLAEPIIGGAFLLTSVVLQWLFFTPQHVPGMDYSLTHVLEFWKEMVLQCFHVFGRERICIYIYIYIYVYICVYQWIAFACGSRVAQQLQSLWLGFISFYIVFI